MTSVGRAGRSPLASHPRRAVSFHANRRAILYQPLFLPATSAPHHFRDAIHSSMVSSRRSSGNAPCPSTTS